MELSPFLHIFNKNTDTNEINPEEMSYNFPFELDVFQKEGIYRIHNNENVLITAHTGSGKTVLAQYAIAHCQAIGKKVIYTSPIKSLSNQKYAEFREKFESVGIMTGDIKVNPEAQCVIMTTEILRNLLYKNSVTKLSKDILQESSISNQLSQSIVNSYAQFSAYDIDVNEIGAVIFDEVHYFNDEDRGKVWEETIILLPPEIVLVMLSATIDKADVFASWIGDIKQKPINLITTSHRVVPLSFYYWKSHMVDMNKSNHKLETKWDLIEIMDEKGVFKNYETIKRNTSNKSNGVYEMNKIMDTLLEHLEEQKFLPCLFFVLSRNKCEELAKITRKSFLTPEEIAEVNRTFDYYMKDDRNVYEKLPEFHNIKKYLLKGVCYHHSTVIYMMREIIEILLSKGLIKVLFGTESLAIGINFNIKTVVFAGLTKYDNSGLRSLKTSEFKQMSGRAGRRGIDKCGRVIILPTFELPSEIELREIMVGKNQIIESKFNLSYQIVLKAIFNNSDVDIHALLSNTLMYREHAKIKKQCLDENTEYEKQLKELELTLLPSNQSTEDTLKIKRLNEINAKLNDTFFSLKKKDRMKLEEELKTIEKAININNVNNNGDGINSKQIIEKQEQINILMQKIDKNNKSIFHYETIFSLTIQKIEKILLEENFISIDSNSNLPKYKITQKGIIASSMNECSELVLADIIYSGLLDNLNMADFIGIISVFLNEGNDTTYISDLQDSAISKNVITILNEIEKLCKYYSEKEDDNQLYINNNYGIYLENIHYVTMWCNEISIEEIIAYSLSISSSDYRDSRNKEFSVGNFIKLILRINNTMENVYSILLTLNKFELCEKLENYNKILIRDITTINSLYIK